MSTESDGSRRELAANSIHIQRRYASTRQLSRVGGRRCGLVVVTQSLCVTFFVTSCVENKRDDCTGSIAGFDWNNGHHFVSCGDSILL